MSKKLFDFLSSFGLMIGGLIMLFLFTVTFERSTQPEKVVSFPLSNPRLPCVGGDVSIVPTLPKSLPTVPLVNIKNSLEEIPLSARSAFSLDKNSQTELFNFNADVVRPLASISKVMSALVLMDLSIDWSSTTTVLESDLDDSSHQIFAGEIFTLNELLSISLVGSSNSAMTILVKESGLSENDFVKLMNEKADFLNLETLFFVEPTGLNSANVGSAKEVAYLFLEAIKYKKIVENLQIKEYYIHPHNKEKSRRLWNTNWLLTNWTINDFNKNKIYGKTGFIYESLYNFVVHLSDEKNHSIITVVMGSETNEERFSETRDLSKWIFKKYIWPDEEEYKNLVE